MNASLKKLKPILWTAAIIFLAGAPFPWVGVGCLHHCTYDCGLPIPWLSVDVGFGAPIPDGDHFLHGPAHSLVGLQIHWLALPFALAGHVLLLCLATTLYRSIKKWGTSLLRFIQSARVLKKL